MNSPCFKILRSYSISLNSSNVGKFYRSWIQKDCLKVQKKGKESHVTSSTKRENRHFRSYSCSDGKKMYQKAWCTYKDVVLLISVNQLLFPRSRFRHRRRCLSCLLSNNARNLPCTQTSLSLSWWKFGRKGRWEGVASLPSPSHGPLRFVTSLLSFPLANEWNSKRLRRRQNSN